MGRAGNIGDVIQVAMRISELLIDRRWKQLMLKGEGSDNGFNGAGGSLGMTDHRFSGADGNARGIIAKNGLVGRGFGAFVIGSRTAV